MWREGFSNQILQFMITKQDYLILKVFPKIQPSKSIGKHYNTLYVSWTPICMFLLQLSKDIVSCIYGSTTLIYMENTVL